jgi:hypothetical protein
MTRQAKKNTKAIARRLCFVGAVLKNSKIGSDKHTISSKGITKYRFSKYINLLSKILGFGFGFVK